MKTWKKVIVAIGAVCIGLFVFATWYRIHFSMDPAKPLEVNRSETREHVLVATQGSAFKDAVVGSVLDRLEKKRVHVKVIDVSALGDVREADWNAIVVLHTWEMSKPPAVVRTFVERVQARDRLVVLATSGEGSQHIQGIDTITSASDLAKAPGEAELILSRLDKILAAQSPPGPQTSR